MGLVGVKLNPLMAWLWIVLGFAPGTPLYRRLKAEGRLLRDHAWDLYTLFHLNIQPKNMTIAELQNGFLKLARTLYSEEETIGQRRKFKNQFKSSRRARLQLLAA